MGIDVKKEALSAFADAVAMRRDIHMHPELGFREFRTAELVERALREAGLRVRRCATTGVIGVLEGKLPGKTLMLRCELDALPITEKNGLDFCSVNAGVMHACGHDCHAACQVQLARILAAHADELPGTVVFLFQPNEEDLGAPQMIEDGALTDPRPDAIIGAHVWSPIDIGKVGMVSGPCCASSYYFKVTLHGTSTHGALPERGVSPIEAGRHVLDAIDSMQTMEFSTLDEPTLITVGSLHSGDYMINIPDELTMEGSIRCLHNNEKAVHARFREIVEKVSEAYRSRAEIEIKCGNNILLNDPELYALARSVAAEYVGSDNITERGVREMGGDDLAEFFREGIPGFYYLVGMGNPKKGSNHAHHNRDFMVDEDAMLTLMELQLGIVLRYLGRE